MQAEELNTLADAIAKRIAPAIPLDFDMWGASEIAALLKVSNRQVTERLVLAPGFPKALRLPTNESSRMQPRWKAKEVLKWIDKQA